jgi:hypothetical protein
MKQIDMSVPGILSPYVDTMGGCRTTIEDIYQLPSRDFSALLARPALRSISRARDKSISPRKLTNDPKTLNEAAVDSF